MTGKQPNWIASLASLDLREDDVAAAVQAVDNLKELLRDRPKQRALVLLAGLVLAIGATWLERREKAKA